VIDFDSQLKLQALVDGELPEAEARELAQGLARDPEAAALLEELRNTRAALTGHEEGVKLPESREFFWSKVQRDIRRLETTTAEPAAAPLSVFLRRWLVPTTALALLFVATLALNWPFGRSGRTPAAEFETALADSGVFTYHDYSAGATLVWLSYPADTEVAENDDLITIE
jgi:anti-sigma factor RsiW